MATRRRSSSFSWFFTMSLCLLCASSVVVSGRTLPLGASMSMSTLQDIKDKALGKLLQVFGISPPSHRYRHLFPPQYMLDLYNSIADSSGITVTHNPYGANVIRSFPDKDVSHTMHFVFNLSGVDPVEQVLQAEFHIYKLKLKPHPLDRQDDESHDGKSHLFEMRIYQVMDEKLVSEEDGNRLLDTRRISSYSIGWEVFHVKTAAEDWLRNHSTNHGLLVTLRSIGGDSIDDAGLIRIAKRRHHASKQPILVLFTDDGRPRHAPNFPSPDELAEWNHSEQDSEEDYWTEEERDSSSRHRSPNATGVSDVRNRRSLLDSVATSPSSLPSDEEQSSEMIRSEECQRYELNVDFEKIGWSGWIIFPKGYNAYHCKGKCSFPLGQNQMPTNHATVQSIVHELQLQTDVQVPCCVPNKLFSISLLYFDGNENVILKQYDDMVAASCACH